MDNAGEGWMKLNVDASVYIGASSFTVGIVLRDHLGTFIAEKNLKSTGYVYVLEVEAIGMQEALSGLETRGLSMLLWKVTLLVINALQNNLDYQLEVGSTLELFSLSFANGTI